MSMLKRLTLIGFAVGALMVATSAQAAQLSGGLSLSSVACVANPVAGCNSVLPVNGVTGVQTTLGIATGLDFTDIGTLTPGVTGTFHVDNSNGNFATIFNTNGAIKDFSFS